MLTNTPFLWPNAHRPGEACLMLHGLGGGVYEMQWLAHELHKAGWTVQGINYPGHDKPLRRMPDSAWQDWYGHIQDSYDALKVDYDRVSLVGFSTGGTLALHLALTESEMRPVDRMILLSPFLKIRQNWFCPMPPERMLPPVVRFVKDIPRKGLPITDKEMITLAHQAAYFRTFNLSAVQSALGLIDVVKPRLEEIQTPTLIIQSRRDSVVCPSGASHLKQHLGSDRKELVWLDTSDHVIMLDQERHRVANVVKRFLDDQPVTS